jgi:hypothetical protein
VAGIGDKMVFHAGCVGFFVGEFLRVGGPPGAVLPVQLFGGGEFGETARERVGGAVGEGGVGTGGKVDHVQIVAFDDGDAGAIGRKARGDETLAGNGGDIAGRKGDADQAVALGRENVYCRLKGRSR